jgi:hypothetical protein
MKRGGVVYYSIRQIVPMSTFERGENVFSRVGGIE